MVSYLNEGVVEFGVDREVLKCGPSANAVLGVVVLSFLCLKLAEHDGGGVFPGGTGGVPLCAFGLFLSADGCSSVASTTQDSSVGGEVIVV